MKKLAGSLLVCSAAFGLAAAAQMPTAPPKVISLYREEVKPARGAQHAALEATYAAHWAKHGVQPYLALNAITGPASDVVFVSSYPGWESVDKDMAAYDKGAAAPEFAGIARKEAELVSSVRAVMAELHPELSYNAEKMMSELPHARYVWIRTVRVKPGHGADFVEMSKALLKAHQDAKVDESWAAYRVVAGAPSGTYLMFQTSRLLAEEEGSDAAHKAMRDAAGAEYAAKMAKLAEASVASDQSELYALSPKMSLVSKEFAAADAAFWTPKPAADKAGAKAMTKKEQKKP